MVEKKPIDAFEGPSQPWDSHVLRSYPHWYGSPWNHFLYVSHFATVIASIVLCLTSL